MDKMTALTIFVAAAEHGSFSRAAEHLGKTPSAITKAIAHLENELGVRLFERTTRRMALTEAGAVYLEGARQALMHLQMVTEEVEQLQYELRGTLRITAPPSFGPAFLNQVCIRFMREHPQVRLEVNLNDANEDLMDGGYDLSLRDGPTDQPELIAQPVIENRVILCSSPDYLARRGASITLENYAQHDWLQLRHPLLNRSFWWIEQNGQSLRVRQPPPRLVSDNFDFLLACLLGGQGLQFVPTWCAAPYLANGQLVEVMPGYWRSLSAFGPWIHVLYLPHRRNTRKVQAFIALLHDQLQEQGLEAVAQG